VGEGKLAQSRPGRIGNRIGDRGGGRSLRRFAGAEKRLPGRSMTSTSTLSMRSGKRKIGYWLQSALVIALLLKVTASNSVQLDDWTMPPSI
jgi:hypothetical protein